jgi:hypothetical protein
MLYAPHVEEDGTKEYGRGRVSPHHPVMIVVGKDQQALDKQNR